MKFNKIFGMIIVLMVVAFGCTLRMQHNCYHCGYHCSNAQLTTSYLSIYLKLDTHLIPKCGVFTMGFVGTDVQFYQFCLLWNATGGTGRIKVNVEIEASPIEGQVGMVIVRNAGPMDRYLFMATEPGRYWFKAAAVDAEGNEVFDNLCVEVTK